LACDIHLIDPIKGARLILLLKKVRPQKRLLQVNWDRPATPANTFALGNRSQLDGRRSSDPLPLGAELAPAAIERVARGTSV